MPDEAPDEVPEEDCRLTVCEVLSVSLDVCCSEPQPAKAKERTKTEPTIIIANTIKGYGSPVMEDKANWHHKVPTAEEAEQIFRDFDSKKEAALNE